MHQDREFNGSAKKLDRERLWRGRPDAQVVRVAEEPGAVDEGRVEVGHHVVGQLWKVGVEEVALEGERLCGEGKFRLEVANGGGVASLYLSNQTETRGDTVGTGDGSVAGQKDSGGGGRHTTATFYGMMGSRE